MYKTDNGVGPPTGPAYRLPEDGPLPDLALYERLIADGIAEADRRRTAVDHVTARRLAIWLAARPSGTGLRPRPAPLRQLRSDPPTPQDRAAQARPLWRLHRPAANRQAPEILHRPGHQPRPDRGLRHRLRPPRSRRRDPRPIPRPGPERPRHTLSRPGPRPTAPGSWPWPAATPRPRRSASSWTTPPPTSPCSPSPLMPTSGRPTSARSSGPAAACPKAPTAAATATPSPPARPVSRPDYEPSNRPTAQPSTAAPRTRRPSPPAHPVPLGFKPTCRSTWRPSRDPRDCGHQRRTRRERRCWAASSAPRPYWDLA